VTARIAANRLDLEHLRTQIGQNLAGHPAPLGGQIEHTIGRKRAGLRLSRSGSGGLTHCPALHVVLNRGYDSS
jgi:hypothetical protein